jgi:TetR/AcrR family transcriptional regulator, transcriptional repressor for nem operon
MAKSNTNKSSLRNTREGIKQLTTELLIRHGYRGTNLRAVAERMHITTTNIHYHFGNKHRLVEEVVREYVSNATLRQRTIWLNDSTSLRQKLGEVRAFNLQRFMKYNRGRRTQRPWSLIGRLRLEIELLSPSTVESLGSFTTDLHRYISTAVECAAEKEELRPGAPLENISYLLVSLVSGSSVFSQDAGSFERLEKLFDAVIDVIFTAYSGCERAKSSTLSADLLSNEMNR